MIVLLSNTSLRPGVFSSYQVSSFFTAGAGSSYAAVVAKTSEGNPNTLYSFESYQQSLEVFTTGGMRGILKILFESGISRVFAVAAEADYAQALTLIQEVDNIGAVVCDAQDPPDLEALQQSVENSSKALRERLAFCGIDDADKAAAAARALNSERVCLCCPSAHPRDIDEESAVFSAAAVAGVILASGDPALNFSGHPLRSIANPKRLSETTIQSLMAAGVTVVELSGEIVRIVRALTTRTSTSGLPDRSMSGINTPLIIDNVISAVRSSLESHVRGRRISGSSFESIASQVTVVLASKRDDGLLHSFMPPRVRRHDSDPSVCVVELSFAVAHVLNQIHVTAHVQI